MSVVTAGWAVVIGAVATVVVLTLSWRAQNNDGSIDLDFNPNKVGGFVFVSVRSYFIPIWVG